MSFLFLSACSSRTAMNFTASSRRCRFSLTPNERFCSRYNLETLQGSKKYLVVGTKNVREVDVDREFPQFSNKTNCGRNFLQNTKALLPRSSCDRRFTIHLFVLHVLVEWSLGYYKSFLIEIIHGSGVIL